jgi:hypothetical protein
MLVKGQDASFQNKVHLTLETKGFIEPKTAKQAVEAPQKP